MPTTVTSANQAPASIETVPLWINGQPADVTQHPAGRRHERGNRSGRVRSVPFANAEDVDAAVKAADAAFPAWRATSPLRRARILVRFRELMEQHQQEIATVVSEEHGKVFLDAMGSVQRGIEVIEFAAGAPHLLKGEHAGSVGRGVDAYLAPAAVGRVRGDHAIQLSGDGPVVDVPHRAGVRQYIRAEAVRDGSHQPL